MESKRYPCGCKVCLGKKLLTERTLRKHAMKFGLQLQGAKQSYRLPEYVAPVLSDSEDNAEEGHGGTNDTSADIFEVLTDPNDVRQRPIYNGSQLTLNQTTTALLSAYGSFPSKEVEDVKTNIKEKGEALVKDVFPAKVIELNKLAQSDLLSLDRMSVIQKCVDDIPLPQQLVVNHGDDRNNQMPKKRKLDGEMEGSQVLVFPEGSIPCNKDIIKITNIIKPLICVLIEHCNSVKMWIQLLIPKIEDGNNFGVSIQEDTLAELRQVESDAASYLDQITRYFITRGKLISKVAKYPHVDDYRRGVEEIDQKEFFNLRLTSVELRNIYLSLLDLIEKNKEKIKKPRNSNAETLY